MTAHTNRSPSPLSSRPSNPNSESYSTTRKSSNGKNPLKPSAQTNPRRFDQIIPVNSPLVFSRQSSTGEESTGSCLKDCEEKENNEKDQKQKNTNVQFPAKGSKNFMAPTISAASKFTPSPRKKPLVERNDPVRTSISLSDGKARFFSNAFEDLEPKSDMNQKISTSLDLNFADSGKNEPFQEALLVPKPSKKVTFSDVPQESLSDSGITDSDGSIKESFSKNMNVSCSPFSNPIAQLHADPSMPYDPKTNFLSPRPQFLYYRPNPRIETLLNKVKVMGGLDEFDQAEDNFISENLSGNYSSGSEGTEVCEKDMVSGLEFSEVDDLIRDSRDSEKEILEVSASSEMVDLELPEVVEMGNKKPWRLSKFDCFSVVTIVLLLAACVPLSVMQSSSFEKFGGVTKDSSFSNLANSYQQLRAEAATDVKVIFDRLARYADQLSVYSIAFFSKVADELGKGKTQLALWKYMNLSDMQMDTWDGGHFLSNNEVGEDFTENNGEDYDELYEELDAEFENLEEEIEAYEEVDDSIENLEEELSTREDEVSETEGKMPGISSNLDSKEDSESQKELVAPNVVPAEQLAQDQESVVEAEIEEDFSPEAMKIEISNVDIINHGPDTALLDQDSPSDVYSLTESVQDSLTPEKEFFTHYQAMGISSLFAVLLAFAAYLYHYRTSLSSAKVIQVNNISSTKQPEKAFSSQNLNTRAEDDADEDVDDVSGESLCPSEMSSFWKNPSSYNNNVKKEISVASEVQSEEKNTRKNPSKRESLASSSSEFTTGSPSYGSFTTFEKIPVKNANGEEEIITPVRRSSRIRNHHHQFTSP